MAAATVAYSFINQYYHLLLEEPAKLPSMYGEDSVFSHASGSEVRLAAAAPACLCCCHTTGRLCSPPCLHGCL